MTGKIIAVVLVVAAAAVLLVAAWPELFGLADAPIIAQVVSLRGVDIVIALTLAVVFAILALIWRGGRRFVGALIVLLLTFGVASFGILAVRGFGGSKPGTTDASDVTVLSWNTDGGKPGVATIARLALAEHADVISLPETTQLTGFDIAKVMKAHGRPMWVYSAAHGYVYQSHATTVLISAALGRYSVDTEHGDTSVLSSIIARPDVGTGPTIVAVHAVSPKPHEMLNWRSDLAFLAKTCAGPNLIMAGDVNSTLDQLHTFAPKPGADFGGCSDAGAAAHAASIGSWPTALPELLGAQIDHVLYTSAWKTVAMRVIGTEDSAGSDHRPIVATLAPAS
jgi:endonuclease/exonuclease/phosphatase (EEP) superfamily protein YafD